MASAPAILGSSWLARLAALDQGGGLPPAFAPTLPGALAYLLLPILLASAGVLFLAPGLFLSLACGRGHTVPIWLLSATPFAIGTAIVVVELSRLAGAARYGVVPGGGLMLAAVGLSGGGVAWLARHRRLQRPRLDVVDRDTTAVMAAALLLVALVLLPKTLWENLNGDGAQTFEVTRLLIRNPLPFFPTTAGALSSYPDWGSLLFAYPGAWFMRLFGETDAAVRMPFFLFLLSVGAGVHALGVESHRRLGVPAVAALWLGLIAYAFAVAFSASNSPYHADLASPAPRETLLLACYLGFVHAIVRREWGWVVGFTVLTYATLPSGVLLIGLWLLSELALTRPVPLGVLLRGGLALAGCIVIARLLTLWLEASGGPVPGSELSVEQRLRELQRVILTDWRRPLYALVGSGVFPMLTLVSWRRQDRISRLVTLVIAGYLLFFLVQPRFSIYHLVPAMILPAIVALRSAPHAAGPRAWWYGAWAAGGVSSILLALPPTMMVNQTSRQVGMMITQRVGNYDASDPAVFRSSTLLRHLFPYEWDPRVPEERYGGSPVAWLRYATHDSLLPVSNFLLGRVGESLPPPWHTVAVEDGFILQVRSDSIWDVLGRLHPPRSIARVYGVSQPTLFGADQPAIIDLRRLVGRMAVALGWPRGVEAAP